MILDMWVMSESSITNNILVPGPASGNDSDPSRWQPSLMLRPALRRAGGVQTRNEFERTKIETLLQPRQLRPQPSAQMGLDDHVTITSW